MKVMPSKLTKPAPVLRREPTQERAERTISVFFEATAQILRSDRDASLNTNKIAERAGFSIGTLYQYFPSKEAIMFALIKRDRARVQQKLGKVLAEDTLAGSSPYEVIKQLIHILVMAYGRNRKLLATMVRYGWQMDQGESMIALNRETSDRIAIAFARFSASTAANSNIPTISLRTQPATLFVMTRAVSGVLRSAALEESDLFDIPEFEEELVRLAWGMLTDDVATEASSAR